MNKLRITTAVVLVLAGCCQKEPHPSLEDEQKENISLSAAPAPKLQVIHTRRFAKKPITQREKKLVSQKDGVSVFHIVERLTQECVDISTLNDGSTRHEECGFQSLTLRREHHLPSGDIAYQELMTDSYGNKRYYSTASSRSGIGYVATYDAEGTGGGGLSVNLGSYLQNQKRH